MFCPTGIPGRPGIETFAVAEDPWETLTTGGDTAIENSSTKLSTKQTSVAPTMTNVPGDVQTILIG
jgi:hypothetical protein